MTTNAPSLRELQCWLKWVVTEPLGVSSALESPGDLSRPEPGRRQLDAIVEEPPLSRVGRLDVYAEAYYSRLLEVLEDDFPTLKRVLGEGIFCGLVAEYLDRHPSRSFTAAVLGGKLAGFLAGHELSDHLPYLSDLARLEWAQVTAFFAPGSAPVRGEALAKITPEQWPSVRFKLDPSCVLLHSRWNIDAMRENKRQPAIESKRWLLVYRKNLRVRVVSLGELEFVVLGKLAEGATLEGVCEHLETKLDVDAELPPLMDWFREWLAGGVIAELAICN